MCRVHHYAMTGEGSPDQSEEGEFRLKQAGLEELSAQPGGDVGGVAVEKGTLLCDL